MDRGVVGVGLGGLEAEFPPEPYEAVFAHAKSLGLGSVPHAGEVAGAASVRGALENLQADRLRHGIRAEEDPGLVRELAGRGTVLDVCPLSNLRTGAGRSLPDHPLPRLVAAGVLCSISTPCSSFASCAPLHTPSKTSSHEQPCRMRSAGLKMPSR